MEFLRYVGDNTFCNEPNYRESLKEKSTQKIDVLPDGGNVSIGFFFNSKKIYLPLDISYVDLLDFAISVYIGDEILSRSSGDDGWTRSFEISSPVHNPTIWKDSELVLKEMLEFLSGDSYSFKWHKLLRQIPRKKHHHQIIKNDFDVICLFSGGIDSFAGANKLLEEKKRVLLVGHYADGLTSSTQQVIFKALQDKFGDQVNLLQCFVAKSKRAHPRYKLFEKSEDTHRTRSFLFLSIALTIAGYFKVNTIYIPENGVIALNIPLTLSRMGSLSTRTTHPRFINLLSNFLNKLGIFDKLILLNPFIFKTKTEVIKLLPQEMQGALQKTISCAHFAAVRWRGKKHIWHCGYCVPCLYRRIALMEIGKDTPRDYAVGVFNDFPKLSFTEKSDLMSLIFFSKKVKTLKNIRINSLVTSHGFFEPEIGNILLGSSAIITDYSPWSDMTRRFVDEFLTKLDKILPAGIKRTIDF
jgi:7-cyano-7-deazaguanine synthase in queuosine biosynthesis